MKRWLVTVGIVLVCVAGISADVTIETTMTVEGKMAAIAGGAMAPKIITRIKGSKSRTDVEIGAESMSMLVDLTTKQAILLNHAQKTANVLDPATISAKTPALVPKIDTEVKPTGQKRAIANEQCDQFSVAMRMDMSPMGSGDSAAAAALKDLRLAMTGSVWVAKAGPGTAEYLAFQAGAAKFVTAALAGRGGAMPGGMEQVILGFAEAPGIPYLTELTMAIEGTGPMVDVMKQMGPMQVTSRVTSVTLDALPEALFQVPGDYKTVKQ
jgi:hypothetical protein